MNYVYFITKISLKLTSFYAQHPQLSSGGSFATAVFQQTAFTPSINCLYKCYNCFIQGGG
jgi:hypothetical protein